jgi:type VI protein secretion system component Hcp
LGEVAIVALDAYLVIANAQGGIVAGEAQTSFTDSFDPSEKFQGVIPVETFSVGAADAVTLGVLGGASKPRFSELVITRTFDKSSVPVMASLFQGQKLDGLQLLLVDGATQAVAVEFFFKPAYVAAIIDSATPFGAGREEVHFEFAAMEIRYEAETVAWSVADNSPNFNSPDLGPGVPGTGGGTGGGTTTTSSSTTVASTTTTLGPGGSVPEAPMAIALPVTAAAVVAGAAVWATRHRLAAEGGGDIPAPGRSEVVAPEVTPDGDEGAGDQP